MRRELKITLAAGILAPIAFLIPITYSVYVEINDKQHWLDSNYLEAVMSSWAATVLGLVAGLPVALWINRLAQSDAAKASVAKAQVEARSREDRVLQIVEQELSDDLATITSVVNGSSLRFHFDVARWNALSAGGDVAEIDDLTILQQVAGTYERIETLNVIARQWLVTMTSQSGSANAGVSAGGMASDTLWSLVIASGNDAMQAIDDTLPAVSGRRTQLQQIY